MRNFAKEESDGAGVIFATSDGCTRENGARLSEADEETVMAEVRKARMGMLHPRF